MCNGGFPAVGPHIKYSTAHCDLVKWCKVMNDYKQYASQYELRMSFGIK